MKKQKLKKIAAIILFVPIAIVAYTLVAMTLWNWLIPDIFDGPLVSFWQMFGLLLLSKMLFFSSGGGSKKWGGKRRCKTNKMARFQEKWTGMSEEEKQAWKQKWNCKTTNDDEAV